MELTGPISNENLKSLGRILRKYGIDRNKNEISVKIDISNSTKAKENFILAINAVNEFCCKNLKM